jgi:RNA polymerase sigma factor (sigma-70 family)
VAVTDLFREHHLQLVRLALVMLGDLAAAEDVVQDAFERLYHGWPGLREPSNGLAYARASVLNGCRPVMRRTAVARKHAPKLSAPRADAEPDTGSAVGARIDLAVALRLLPKRQREVLVLRYYLDLDSARSQRSFESRRARSDRPAAAGWPQSLAHLGRNSNDRSRRAAAA